MTVKVSVPPQPEPETVSEKISFSMFKKKAAERKPEKAQMLAKARRAMKRRNTLSMYLVVKIMYLMI